MELKLIWIILLISITMVFQIQAQNFLSPIYCSPLNTTMGDVQIAWPFVGFNQHSVSVPVCLDELKFPKYRYYNQNCMNSELFNCSYIQPDEVIPACPDGEPALVIDNKYNLCFSKSTRYSSEWDYTSCLPYGSTAFDFLNPPDWTIVSNIVHYIANNFKTMKFWLPIRRDNVYAPLQYYLPFLWKKYDMEEKYISGSLDYNKNCLTVEFINGSFYYELENCKNRYPLMCAYDILNYRKIDCFNDTVCFGNAYNCTTMSYVLHPYPNTNKYSFLEDGLNCLYGRKSIADSSVATSMYTGLLQGNWYQCIVSVVSESNKVINYNMSPVVGTELYESVTPCGKNCALNISDWVANVQQIEYTNWNGQDLGSGENIVVDSSGQWQLASKSSCTICEDIIGSTTIPTIILECNQDHQLTLTVSIDYITTPEMAKSNSLEKLCNFKELLGISCFAQYENLKFENFQLNERTERNFNTYSSENILTVIDIISISYNEVYTTQVNKSGLFWCEGYSVFHDLLISSDSLYVNVADAIDSFAVIVKFHSELFDKFEFKPIYSLANSLVEIIQHYNEKFTETLAVNIQKIISVEPVPLEVVALVHFETELPIYDDTSDEFGVDSDILLTFKMNLWNTMKTINGTDFTFYSINHTQFCLPEVSQVNGTNLNWRMGVRNEYVTTTNFDLDENGLPIVRQCIGDSLYGLEWRIVNELNVGTVMSGGPITKELFNLERLIVTQNNKSLEIIRNISSILYHNIDSLISADLFTISKVLSYLNDFNFTHYTPSNNFDGVIDLTTIIDSCTQVNETVIQKSQLVNTTNRILYSFEMAIGNIGTALNPKQNTFLVKSSNVLVVVLNPYGNNVSGIAVYKNLTKTTVNNDISDYYVEYIVSNASITTFNEGFAIASYVPENILENLLTINQQLQIIITIFYNDVLYQDDGTNDQLDSIVISVTIPGVSSRLPGFMPFYFTSKSNSIYTVTTNSSINNNNYCSYWNLQPKDESKKSEWSQDGCYFMGLLTTTLNTSQISACACEHLTSFAFLVGDMEVTKTSGVISGTEAAHNQALDIITLVGCSLSLLGVLGIFITALIFPVWRRKTAILLQFSAAIALQMVLTLCVTTHLIHFKFTANWKKTGCIILGAAIQYSLLVVFSWMLISAYLQFKRYVRVFNSKPLNLYIKSFIIGWLMPLIPVLLGVLIWPTSYSNPIQKSFHVCYPMGNALYYTVLLPISLIVFANLTIFIFVVRNVCRMSSNKMHSHEKALILSQLRLSVFLFFLLGLSWIFGLANSFGFGIVFTYLFCLTATVQGLVLFIYFILMDPETRLLWINCLCFKRNSMINGRSHQ